MKENGNLLEKQKELSALDDSLQKEVRYAFRPAENAFLPLANASVDEETLVMPEVSTSKDKIQYAFRVLREDEVGKAFTFVKEESSLYENSSVGANSEKFEIETINTDLPNVAVEHNKDLVIGDFSLSLIGAIFVCEGNTIEDAFSVRYIFVVSYKFGNIRAIVNEDELYDFSWIVRSTHGLASNENGFKEKVRMALENFNNIKLETVFLSTGWKNVKGIWAYVTDDGAVGDLVHDVRSEAGYRLEVNENLVGTYEGAVEFLQMQRILKNTATGKMLILFALMSTLTSIFELAKFPLQFVLGLCGTTNSFKTSLGVVFSSIFNATSQQRPTISFASTKGGIEKEIGKLDDAILLLDDRHPGNSSSENKELNERFNFVCRAYGDRVPKRRMNDFNKQLGNKYPIRGMCMVTGELVSGVQSSLSRLLILKVSKGDVDTNWLSHYQENTMVLPSFIKGFLKYVSGNMQEVVAKIESGKRLCRSLTGFNVPRFRDVYGQFCIVADLFCQYLGTLGIFEHSIEWKNAAWNQINDYQKEFAEKDIPHMIAEALMEAINIYGARCLDNLSAQCAPTSVFGDSAFYYIRAEGLLQIVANFYRLNGKDFVLTKEQLIQSLKENGIIETFRNSKGNIESARKLGQHKGIHVRYLYIRKEKIKALLDD